jgi:hypothetical protein
VRRPAGYRPTPPADPLTQQAAWPDILRSIGGSRWTAAGFGYLSKGQPVSERDIPARVVQHAAAFNAAVRSGDWSSFADRFTPDATMRFTGVPVPPVAGRAAIARAYAEQPPTGTLTVGEVDSAGPLDTVRFTWDGGGTGVMRLTWQDRLIAALDVSFGG